MLPLAPVRRRRRGRAGASPWARTGRAEEEELELGVVLLGRRAAIWYSKKVERVVLPGAAWLPRRVVVDCQCTMGAGARSEAELGGPSLGVYGTPSSPAGSIRQ